MEIAHRDEVSREKRAWWDAVCRDTAEAMQDYCLPYVTPISHAISNDEGALKGTGGYLEFAGKRWLISNEHVLGDWEIHQFAHQFHGCDDVFGLVGAPTGIEKHPVDTAIWHIPDDVWNARLHQAVAVPSSRLAHRHAPVPGELLFVMGFPQQRSSFYFNTLASRATQLIAQERNPSTVDDLHANYVLVGYSTEKAQTVKLSGGASLSQPPGMSGSLLWNTRRVECEVEGRSWTPSMAQVTGMLCRWDPQLVSVQAVRIEVIREFLERHIS